MLEMWVCFALSASYFMQAESQILACSCHLFLSGSLELAEDASSDSVKVIASYHILNVELSLLAWRHPTTESRLGQSWKLCPAKHRQLIARPTPSVRLQRIPLAAILLILTCYSTAGALP